MKNNMNNNEWKNLIHETSMIKSINYKDKP